MCVLARVCPWGPFVFCSLQIFECSFYKLSRGEWGDSPVDAGFFQVSMPGSGLQFSPGSFVFEGVLACQYHRSRRWGKVSKVVLLWLFGKGEQSSLGSITRCIGCALSSLFVRKYCRAVNSPMMRRYFLGSGSVRAKSAGSNSGACSGILVPFLGSACRGL